MKELRPARPHIIWVYLWDVYTRQIHRDRKQISCLLGAEQRGKWGMTANGCAGWWKCPGITELWWFHSLVDVMKTTELYSFKGWILQYVNHINKVKLSAVAWGENQLEMDAFLKIRYDYNMKFKLEGDVERESSVEMLDLQNLPWPCGIFFLVFFLAHTCSKHFHLYTGQTLINHPCNNIPKYYTDEEVETRERLSLAHGTQLASDRARFQPKSAVAEADAFSIAPLANFFFFLSYTWFYLRNSRFSLFLTQRNLSQDNAHQPSLELFHFHKQLESYYLWREQSLSFNQCLLSAFCVAHTVLETGDVAVNTNKTFSFL